MDSTKFGNFWSDTHYNLIQQSVTVHPAEPKLNFLEADGFNGSIDVTDSFGVDVRFKNRDIDWVFALNPGMDWRETQRTISRDLNGLRLKIILSDDQNYYYMGRVKVNEYKRDEALKQITLTANCDPFMYYADTTQLTATVSNNTYQNISISNDKMPVIPTIIATKKMVLLYDGDEHTVDVTTGTTVSDLVFKSGTTTLRAKLFNSGETNGLLTFVYRQGAV